MTIRIDGTNTTANPGITGADADTGLQFGTDEVRIVTGGSDRITVDASGRVGVGTTSPSVALELDGATDPVIRINRAATSHYVDFSSASGAATINSVNGAGGALIYKGDGSEKLRIDTSGRLLVGTSSTSATSSVIIQDNSAASGPGILRIANSSATPASGNSLGLITFGASNHVTAASINSARDGGTWTAGSSQPSRLEFSVTKDGNSSPSERFRITQNGLTWHFSEGPGFIVQSKEAAGTATSVFNVRHSATSIAGTGTDSLRIYTNGNVVNTNNSYTALSDIKLKENVVNASSQWDDIKALQVRNYNLKEGQTHKQIGLIAQEVEPICPGLVYETPDADAEGNDLGTVTKSVNYSVLYMKAVKALQEAMERIETLEARLTALEGGTN